MLKNPRTTPRSPFLLRTPANFPSERGRNVRPTPQRRPAGERHSKRGVSDADADGSAGRLAFLVSGTPLLFDVYVVLRPGPVVGIGFKFSVGGFGV